MYKVFYLSSCADPESFSEGVQLFLVYEWVQIQLKSGHRRPASETPSEWRFAGGPMIAQHNTLNARMKDLLFFKGSEPVLQKNPIFCHFPLWEGGGSGPSVPL